jgi:hypothetical protein
MPLEVFELASPEYLHIQEGGRTMYGCDQDWYQIQWREKAGCGPVTATNLLLYLIKKHRLPQLPYQNRTVAEALCAMDDVFTFVRPTIMGLHTVKLFVNGVRKLARRYHIRFCYHFLNVPPCAEKRPDIRAVQAFIESGIRSDAPVAFLNLHAGDVETLDTWHWVTIVGIAVDSETGGVMVRFYDHAQALEMDMGQWLRTTRRGGGFVYFGDPFAMGETDGTEEAPEGRHEEPAV